MAYILTLDAGTSGVKCTLFDERCAVFRAERADYGTDFPHPGWAQQAPEPIYLAACGAVKALMEGVNPADVAVIGLSGTMNGCIPIDAAGKALYPNIIHSDSRTAGQLADIRRVIDDDAFYRLTGNRLDNHYTLPKILWLKENEPDVYRRAAYFVNTKDYLYTRLTGRVGVTDFSDASLTIAMDIRRGEWAGDMLAALGLDVSRMPRIEKGTDVTGRLSREAAEMTGLLAGTPVAVGGGDGACAARGCGLYKPGSAYGCLGSSSWISQLTDRPVIDPKARVFNYLDMDGVSNHCCGTIQCGGDALNWAVGNLLGPNMTIAEAERLASTAKPGAEGVLFLPTLMGERTPYWDANTRGVLMGFSLYHNQAHVARAVYEGVAFALGSCAFAMADCGMPVRSLMLTGGGAQSALWPKMLASLLGVDVRVHSRPGEGTSLGAAMTAGVGLGLFTFEEASSLITARSACAPDADWAKAYERVYPVYASVYERAKPLFDSLAGLVV